METPIGRLWLATGDAGLVAISRSESPEQLLVALRRRGLAGVVDPDPLREPISQLMAYFSGARVIEVPVDLRGLPTFHVAVYRAAVAIPYGATVSYRDLAVAAGSPRAARAVGAAMARCPLFPVVPCHRVIHADGSLGGWGADPRVKRWLLDLENGARRWGAGEADQIGLLTVESAKPDLPPPYGRANQPRDDRGEAPPS